MELLLKSIPKDESSYEYLRDKVDTDIYLKWNQSQNLESKYILVENVSNNIKPIKLVSERLDIEYDEKEIIEQMITFVREETIQKLFSAKVIKKFVSNFSEDKWNIDVIKVLSFVLDMRFMYRNNVVQFKEYGNSYSINYVKN